jgi:hypothetical protein
MSLPVLTCRRLLGVLGEFYDELPEPPPLEAAVIQPAEMPQPQRRLLVHHKDMTSTLQRHYGEPVALRVLDRKLHDDYYARHIVLETARTRRPAEYGAIRIYLPSLSPPAQQEVLEARAPLGGILGRHGLAFRCCPGAFFKVLSNALINRSLGLSASEWLYGRCNCLGDAAGRTIAEVIEILPPDHGAGNLSVLLNSHGNRI